MSWLTMSEDWAICTSKSNHNSFGNLNLYGFDACPSVDDAFTWPSLLRKGHDLAKQLLAHCARVRVRLLPT